jgi:G3E family GTPase
VSDSRVPVHVLTGFLGAGKTTLLNRLLNEPHGARIAVLVNEFGDVPIDGRLVVRAHEELIELANGCVCCTIRGDLARALIDLFARRRRRIRRQPFDAIVIETSGLASPGPVLQTLIVEPELAQQAQPMGVVALTHAAEIAQQLERHAEAREQLGYADLILLNHTDRAGPDALAAAEKAIRSHNAIAPLERTQRAEIALERVFGLRPSASAVIDPERVHAAHTEGAGTVVLRSDAPLDLHALKLWLQFLATRRTHEIWRLKGILACREERRSVVVQGVYQWLEIGAGDEVPPTTSVLVLIGRDLDEAELQRGWAAVTRG